MYFRLKYYGRADDDGRNNDAQNHLLFFHFLPPLHLVLVKTQLHTTHYTIPLRKEGGVLPLLPVFWDQSLSLRTTSGR